MSEELVARLMERITVPPLPFDAATSAAYNEFTKIITELRAMEEPDVLADAKARVEGLRQTTSRIPIDQAITYNRAIDHALAALTQPQTEKLGSCVEHGTWDIYECEYGQCPQCGDKLVPGPFPYAKAFRERVCPVPEFPAWNPQPGDAIKKEES